MEPTQFLAMVNSFDEVSKVNLKNMLYKNKDRSEDFNIRGNNQFVGANLLISKESNPLYDEICNTREPNLQVEPEFDTYLG